MTITISGTRPKLNQTLAYDINIVAKTPVEDSNDIILNVVLSQVDIDPVDVTCDLDATTTLTTTNAAFADVRVGDAVSGTGIDVNTTVTAIAEDNNSLTLSTAATATLVDETITFDAGNIDVTIYSIKLEHAVQSSTKGTPLNITPTIYLYDGTVAKEGDTDDDYDNAQLSDAVSNQAYNAKTVDIDAVLTNARKQRTNS